MTSLPTLAASEEHELALLLSGRCRRCAERLPGGTALRGRPCPRCGEETLPSATDRAVLHELHGAQSAVRLWLAVAAVAVGAMVASWFPLINSLLIIGALVWLRFTIVKPGLSLLTPRRRIVTRWTLRLAAGCFLALSFIVLELLTFIPGAGALVKTAVSALEVAGAGLMTRRYLTWQIRREGQGAPVALWELALLAAWALVLALTVALLVVVVLWLLSKLGLLESRVLGAMPGVKP
ncbi:hypothetical protein [Hyalangium rubrum]|uniref:Uncharacterized protein n=1 Tax=Hyalangium rubrum TaxID=3103134 RepID=A0ABU5H1P2_9BACT|nr:hypothetical protein [Hyalangium sp. s54d21]MDY7227359.1 hypothetical protein [Hyalangium sp. s54d21]